MHENSLLFFSSSVFLTDDVKLNVKERFISYFINVVELCFLPFQMVFLPNVSEL